MVALLVKGIKPKKLQIDKIRRNLLDALETEGRLIAREFDKTTASWSGEKPRFEVETNLSSRDAEVLVGPTGADKAVDKWVWLDQGTRPHVIRPVNAKRLAFRANYRPKTRVGVFGSAGGGSSGPRVFAKSVQHPGTEARNWSEDIVKRRRKPFTRNMIAAAKVVT
jgi:hypothetical protein